ncbi:MAG: hypothetical protein WAX85_00970 [Minisyncoccia bacterium]
MKSRSTKIKKLGGTPLAVVEREEEICMYVRVDNKTTSSVNLLYSLDGVDFIKDPEKVVIKNLSGKKEKIKNCDRFSVSRTPNGYVMTYVRSGTKKAKSMLVVSRSSDLYEWNAKSELPVDEFHHTTIVYDKPRDSFELYRDGLFIKHQSSMTLSVWKDKPHLVFTGRSGYFDIDKLSIIGSVNVEEGILLLYDASVQSKSKMLLQVGAVIIDRNSPRKVTWRSSQPVWQGVVEAKKKSLPTGPLGFVTHKNNFFIYWITADFNLILVKIKSSFKEIDDNRYHPKILNRFHGNPIIEPRSEHDWEVEGTFNPAVVEDDEGTIHLLYRAIGKDGISRVGYAKSKNGTYFTKRSSIPVFEPIMGYGLPDPSKVKGPVAYNPVIYTSGGGWGGSEDPRLVKIEDTVYMIYVAFEGWGSMRIALTSISLEDFKAGKWKWKKPTLISPPNKMAKNWLLFPEKINGRYAILHGLAPKVLVDYVDDLDNFKDYIYSVRPEGAPQPGRKNAWDGLLRGGGPPPIKTELGWLLLYHALDKTDSSKYKLGAMILDKDDPTKILYRSKHPILSPDMHYENNGKPGIVYASGALIRDDDLYIYYGGADKVVCVATTPLKKLLKYLQTGNAEVYQLKKI